MNWRPLHIAIVTLSLVILSPEVSAYPAGESESRRQGRDGIFDDNLWANILLTLLPFPIFFCVAALVSWSPLKKRRYGLPHHFIRHEAKHLK